METFDFIIVGGGIAGASAGFELAALGTVLLLEREAQFGYHSTGRSAAVFLKSHGPDVIRTLASASKEFLLHPPDGFADYSLLKPRGLLLIGGRGDAAALDRTAEECRRHVDGVRRLNADDTRAMVPVLRDDYLGGAVFDPEAMDIDVHSLHYGFLRGLQVRGGKSVTDAEVTSIEHERRRWTVRTTSGNFASKCAGKCGGRLVRQDCGAGGCCACRTGSEEADSICLSTSAWSIARTLAGGARYPRNLLLQARCGQNSRIAGR